MRVSSSSAAFTWPCYDETPSRRTVLARAALGGPDRRRAARAVCRGRARSAGRGARRRVSGAADDRPAAGFVQHAACRAAATPRRCGAARARHLAAKMPHATACENGERVRVSVAARLGRRSGSHRSRAARRAGLHDASLQRRVATNLLTIDATDPKSGTAEFKACRRAHRTPCKAPSGSALYLGDCRRGDERDAVDALLGEPSRSGKAARDAGICCCRCCTRYRSACGWISAGALNYVCERLGVPPADAYGVATFYAMFSTKPRPPARVCTFATTSRAWARRDDVCDALESACGPAGTPRRRARDVAAQSVPGLVRSRAGGAAIVAGEHPLERQFAPINQPVAATSSRPLRRGAIAAAPHVGGTDCGCCGASARSIPSVSTRIAPTAAIARSRAPSSSAASASSRRSPLRSCLGRGGAAFPAGRKMRSGRSGAGAAALSRLQRRRIGARNVQRPHAHGARSVRDRRGDDDRRLCRGLRARLHLHSRRVSAGDAAPRSTRSTQRARRDCSATT